MTLARALYGEADIYLFDDPISAVDSKVAKLLFERCIKPLSEEKLVILVSHQIGYIEQCDEVLVMNDGEMVASGTPLVVQKFLLELSQV